MDQPVINSSVRLITHRQINPCFFIYNALIMREGLESFLSVIASHTAFPEAAKRHFAGGKVDDHIVDTAAAEATFGGDLLTDGFVLGENVKSQRMSHGVYFADHFVNRSKGKDGHHRTKDFFLHNRIFKGYLVHDGGLNLQGFRTDAAAADNFCRIDQVLNAVEMLFIDDLSVIFVIQRRFAKLLTDLFLDLFQKLIFYFPVTVM
jgi:hypothetical protein